MSFAKFFSTMPTPPEITAIVVSWNVREQLERCLNALTDSQDVFLHIMVVDNGSSDGSAVLVRERFTKVKLITNPDNRGFAAAVNQALAHAASDVVLVNPDLEVKPDTLAALAQALARYPKAGIVGPKISYQDGQLQPSVRYFPTTRDLLLTLLKLPNLLPLLTAHYAGLQVSYDQEQLVDQVMGSCFYIRRSTLEQIGHFDEGFFLWFEEVDFCKRASQQGWQTLYTPSAQATHEKNASFSQQKPLWRHRVLVKSMVHYAKKHLGFWAGEIVLATGVAATLLTFLQQLLNLRKPQRARDL